jgi:hypothetical protein
MPRWLIAVIAAVVAGSVVVLVAATLIVDLGESAGAEEGITLRQVADRPSEFAGERVIVSGEIAENDYFSLADAQVVFAIGDDAGDRRLLVYPQPQATVPDMSEDTAVRVEGTVRAIDPQADDTGGFVDIGGLLGASDATAVIEATRIEIVAPSLNAPPPPAPVPTSTTIARLLADPEDFRARPVSVPGRVTAIFPSGFLLGHQGERMFVGAPASDLDDLRSGRRVRVRGELARLSQFRAKALTESIHGSSEGADPASDPKAGDVFLVLRALRDASGDPIASRPGENAEGAIQPAAEGNTVDLGAIEYRVTMFRQINPRIPPDQALIEAPPDDGHAYYAAFIAACNTGAVLATTTSRIHLENAFGAVYRPVAVTPSNELWYRSTALEPDECLPAEDGVADSSLPGAALVFEVPIDDLSERPFILELRGPDAGSDVRRVELDL